MPLQVKCPSCSTMLRLPDTVPPGGSVRCPKCQTVLKVPGKAPAPQAAAPAAKPPTPPPAPVQAAPSAAPKKPSRSPQTTRPQSPQAIAPTVSPASTQRQAAKELRADDDDDLTVKAKPKSKKGLVFGILGCVGLLFLVCGGGLTFGIYKLVSGAKKLDQQLTEELKKQTTAPNTKPAEQGPGIPPNQQPPDWKPFASQEGKFSALFPGTPTQTSSNDRQGTTTYTIMVELNAQKTAYMVMYNDMPAGVTEATSKFLFDTVAKNFGPAVKKKKDIKLDGHPGIELELEQLQDRDIIAITDRIYLVDRRMYQVMASAAKDKKDPAQFAEFLDSFKLRKPTDPPAPPAPPGPVP
jgi:LSD1 subclass zinc finger protein